MSAWQEPPSGTRAGPCAGITAGLIERKYFLIHSRQMCDAPRRRQSNHSLAQKLRGHTITPAGWQASPEPDPAGLALGSSRLHILSQSWEFLLLLALFCAPSLKF